MCLWVIRQRNASKIHPEIVAGRVRHETKSFRMLSQFVGAGELRRQLLGKEARACAIGGGAKLADPWSRSQRALAQDGMDRLSRSRGTGADHP
jgi:hypothetical protein